MKDNESNKTFKNRCYGCLSLRSGVFINSFCIVTLPFLADFAARSVERAYAEYLTEDPTPFVTRYYHFTLPYMSAPVNAFTVVSNTMHIVGMIGCYKKSPRLIKYHKNYLWLDCITTPFVLLECVYSWYNDSDRLVELNLSNMNEVDEFRPDPRSLLIYASFFIGSFALITFAQQIYSAYVAYKYERYLTFHSNDLKEK